MKFKIKGIYSDSIEIVNSYEEIEKPKETFEFKYISSDEVVVDFKEALICYSNSCFNAFGAMCRRCVQSISTELGAKDSAKVLKQLEDIKDTAEIEDEVFDELKQIIISGHDGAHPHLPKLSPERAKILLELMKDILYQLFVRKAKIMESKKLRENQIEVNK